MSEDLVALKFVSSCLTKDMELIEIDMLPMVIDSSAIQSPPRAFILPRDKAERWIAMAREYQELRPFFDDENRVQYEMCFRRIVNEQAIHREIVRASQEFVGEMMHKYPPHVAPEGT